MSPYATQPDYRPDIDGLRALAVFGVIFYHLDFPLVSGGFAGVDVFFVISGYLITKVIAGSIENGTFSFLAFYARRARRLFPALLATVLATFVAASALLPVQVFELYANSVVTTLFSVSNIFFWKESGYFDADAHLKPLLHTWSLSVEEQFYIVWPATLVLLSRLARPWAVPAVLVFILVFGTAFAEYWLTVDQSGAFYLAPFRAGEFAIGALCVWLMRRSRPGFIVDEVIAIIGIALIVATFIGYSQATPFPGLATLPPCLGAACLIYSGQARYAGRLLSNRVAQNLGLISYSLYLVHWPIIVFASFYKNAPLAVPEKWAVVALALALAGLQYHFVEKQFRWGTGTAKPRLPAGAFLLRCLALSAAVSIAPIHIMQTGGWSWRPSAGFGPSTAQIQLWKKDRMAAVETHCRGGGEQLCNRLAQRDNILILGDSHALDAFNAFVSVAPSHNYIMNAVGGCPPLVPQDLGFIKPAHPNFAVCQKLSRQRNNPAFIRRFDVIVISLHYVSYTPDYLRRYLTFVRAHSSAKIIILGSYIVLKRDCALIAVKEGAAGCIDPKNVSSFAGFEDELAAIAAEFGAVFISKREIFCGEGDLQNCRFEIDGVPFTADRHHLTLPFAHEMGTWIKQHHVGLLPDLAAPR